MYMVNVSTPPSIDSWRIFHRYFRHQCDHKKTVFHLSLDVRNLFNLPHRFVLEMVKMDGESSDSSHYFLHNVGTL